jgi:hypothetical protein
MFYTLQHSGISCKWNYWVDSKGFWWGRTFRITGFCSSSGVLETRKQRFGNWICFHPLVEWKTPTQLGPLGWVHTKEMGNDFWELLAARIEHITEWSSASWGNSNATCGKTWESLPGNGASQSSDNCSAAWFSSISCSVTRFSESFVKTRGGSRIGTVELQHPLLPLDIIDNI